MAQELLGGRYEIVARVADGPVSVLWRGVVRGGAGFTRPVAIREVRAELARDGRFLGAWAATAAGLAEAPSPHVEQAIDFVVTDRAAYVISEWIEGVSLARFVDAHLERTEDVPWPLAVEIAIEMLRGLADAHARWPALCHDGLGLEAVRIAQDGTVKLTRFGMATALAATGAGRRQMEELGLRHPAPELVLGDGADAATDQFGVGALLFALLTGEPLFDAPPGPSRDALLSAELPDLAGRRPDVPPLLVASIERALRRDPVSRFESVGQMARALSQLLRSQPGPSGPALLAEFIQSLWSEAPAPSERPPSSPEGGAAALAASVRAMLGDAPEPTRAPAGLPAASTMHVDLDELTELYDPAAPPPLEAPRREPGRARPYQFGFKRRSEPKKEEPTRAPLPRDESEAAPLLLTKRPQGLRAAKTEFLDEDQVDSLTLDLDESDADDDDAAPARRSLPVPLGIGVAKTEYLEDGELDTLRLDEDD